MNVVWLSWCISVVMALLFFVSSMISYAPAAQRAGALIQAICGAGALFWTALALWLRRYPRDHWVHRSRSLWALLTVVAIMATVMVALVG